MLCVEELHILAAQLKYIYLLLHYIYKPDPLPQKGKGLMNCMCIQAVSHCTVQCGTIYILAAQLKYIYLLLHYIYKPDPLPQKGKGLMNCMRIQAVSHCTVQCGTITLQYLVTWRIT